MRKLNSTVVNEGGKTATVGGGALQWEITSRLFKHEKQAGRLSKSTPLRNPRRILTILQ